MSKGAARGLSSVGETISMVGDAGASVLGMAWQLGPVAASAPRVFMSRFLNAGVDCGSALFQLSTSCAVNNSVAAHALRVSNRVDVPARETAPRIARVMR